MTSISTMRKPSSLRAVKAANMRKLVERMCTTEMTGLEMQNLLEYSPSGIRKYIRDLFIFKIIEIARYVDATLRNEGRPVYRLVDDSVHVMEFLEQLETRLATAKPERVGHPTALDIARRRGRNFHLMQDDAYFGVRVQPVSVAPDPRALPPEFFKPVVQHDEPLPRVVREQSAAPAWPQPSDYKMEFAA